MRYRKVTKRSIQFISDEDKVCRAITILAERATGYEYKLVSDFVTAIEIYFGDVSKVERRQFIREIARLFKECLEDEEVKD